MVAAKSILYSTLQKANRLILAREAGRELAFQKRMRKQSYQALADYSFAQAVAYANRMAEASPLYKQRLCEAGIHLPIEPSVESWRQLPTLRKADFQKNPEQWINPALDSSSLHWSCTSGSSGEPYRFPETAASLRAEYAAWELDLLEMGWRPGEPEAIVKMDAAPVYGTRAFIRRLLGTMPLSFSAVKFRVEDTPRIVEALNRNRVEFLRGYPFVLLLLSEEMLRRGLRCHVPHIVTFGEGISPGRAKVVEEAFQGRVCRDYGGSEAMHVGFQCLECGEYHLDLTRFWVEVLDGDRPVKPGETGEIVVTCFRNAAMPFVRYRMGDLGVLTDPEAATCPRAPHGAARLATIQGRIFDVIRTPNGKLLDTAFLVWVMEYAHEHVVAFKVLQTRPDLVEILYVPRHERAGDFLGPTEKQIVERTDGSIRVAWKPVTEIPLEASGKRKILVPLKADWKNSVD